MKIYHIVLNIMWTTYYTVFLAIDWVFFYTAVAVYISTPFNMRSPQRQQCKKLQSYEITHDYVLDLTLIFCFQVNEAKPREGGGGGGGYGGGRGGGRGGGYGGGRGGGGYGGGTV